MKKIHYLIIQTFIRPFIVTFFIVMFILLMFFLFKYIDEMIGKGFEWYVILELMFYNSATNVSTALPLSILLSSIMTFGTLGENYELVAIKSAGISLRKAMTPLFVLIIFISIGSFFFSDYILPKATLKYGSLLYDIRNKPLSFLIKEGVFNTSIPNYAIKVDRKGGVDSLFGIMIYDHSNSNGISKIILAREGRMYKTNDNNYLVIKLKDGIRYEESSGGSSSFNPRQVFSRMRFKETEPKFDFSSLQMKRTDESGFANVTEMLNLKGLKNKQDSLEKALDSVNKYNKFSISSYYKQNAYTKGYTRIKSKPVSYKNSILNSIPGNFRDMSLVNAVSQVESINRALQNQKDDHAIRIKDIIKTYVEYQRKFTLAVSCLLLFFIGAPLGAIIRKGGLGLPVVIAVVFFLIYHILSTVAEKSAKEGSLDVEFGMWLAIITLSPVGAFLTYKATVDSALFDVDYYKELILKIFRRKKPREAV